MQRGALRLPDLAPGATESVEIAGLNPEAVARRGGVPHRLVRDRAASCRGHRPGSRSDGSRSRSRRGASGATATDDTQPASAVEVDFDTENGLLTGIRLGGHALLTTAPELSLWRAATDNDGLKLAPSQELKPLGRWRNVGLDHLTRSVDRVRTKNTSDGTNDGGAGPLRRSRSPKRS